jgi:hypothetical protein
LCHINCTPKHIENAVREEQSGGRPETIAAQAEATAKLRREIICLQQMIAVTLYNDATACFDRIIENVSNATLLSEGLHPTISRLHAQTIHQDQSGNLQKKQWTWLV